MSLVPFLLNDPFFNDDLDVFHHWPSKRRHRDVWGVIPVAARGSHDQLKDLTPILSADLVEGERDYTVHVDLPGVQPADVDVSVSNGMLNIKAERRAVHEEGDGTRSHRIERSHGKVQRSVALPRTANPDSADCEFINGVLKIKFDKREEAPASRKLEVRTSPRETA